MWLAGNQEKKGTRARSHWLDQKSLQEFNDEPTDEEFGLMSWFAFARAKMETVSDDQLRGEKRSPYLLFYLITHVRGQWTEIVNKQNLFPKVC